MEKPKFIYIVYLFLMTGGKNYWRQCGNKLFYRLLPSSARGIYYENFTNILIGNLILKIFKHKIHNNELRIQLWWIKSLETESKLIEKYSALHRFPFWQVQLPICFLLKKYFFFFIKRRILFQTDLIIADFTAFVLLKLGCLKSQRYEFRDYISHANAFAS